MAREGRCEGRVGEGRGGEEKGRKGKACVLAVGEMDAFGGNYVCAEHPLISGVFFCNLTCKCPQKYTKTDHFSSKSSQKSMITGAST